MDAFDPNEKAGLAVVAALAAVAALSDAAEVDPDAAAPKLKLGVIEGPTGF